MRNPNSNYYLRTFLRAGLVVAIWVVANSAYSQYTVDFEGAGETKAAYASGSVTLSGISWNMTEALIGTLAADWKNGVRSARMRGYGTSSMTMLANKSNGIGAISFSYRRYGTDTQVDWKVEYSSNDGADWTQIGSAFTAPASDIVQTFSESVNVSGNIRIRIKRATESGTTDRRLNIDDISITDYSSPCAVSITSFSPTSGSPGAIVTLTGTNFTGTSAVTFNGVAVSSYTVINPTTIEATIPAGTAVGTTATFTVTQGCDVTSSSTFTVKCPVTVTSFSPITGPIGTLVTITGTDFTGATNVTFNGVSASSYTVVNATTITATVPSGANTGKIAVTQGCTATSSGDFTIIGQSGTCTGSTPATDLIFSEYIEGNSNNKAIEIFNGTGGDIDLGNYTIMQSNNGAGWGETSSGPDTRYVLPLSGTLANGDVYVIANSSANASILAAADIALTFNGTANGCSGCNVPAFNGNDGLGLFKTGVIIDQIGVESPDPGTAWDVAGVTNATKDHTLVRKSDVISPTSNWATSAGTDAINSQWAVSAVDYSSNLGSHTFSSGGSPIVITTQPISVSQCEGNNATFTVEATGATSFQWYENTGGAWTLMAGEESLTLEIAVAAGMDGCQYYCLLTEGTCNVASNAVQLTISGSCCLAPADLPTALSFTNVTANSMDVDWNAPASGCDGYVVKIGTDAAFDPLVDGVSLPSGSSEPWDDEDIVLTASTSTGFTIGSLDANTEYHFKVYPYNLCGSTYKFNNTGLSDFLTTSNQTYPLPVCAEGTVTLSLENFNEINAEYQWQVFDGSSWSNVANGGSYSGATSRELIIDPVLQSMNGYIYVCQVSNSVHGCTTPSVSFTLTVNPLPATPIIESVTQNCGSTNLTMATPPSGVTWYWQTTANATNTGNSALTLNVIADGTYYLRAESADGCWSTNSASEIVIVKEVPVVNDFILTLGCGSGSAYIESSITGLQTFELLDDTGAPLVPPRSATFDGNSFTFNGIVSGDYTAKVTYNGCTSVPIAPETLVNNIIAGQPTVSDETICGAGTATLSAVLGTNATVVEWSLDGVAIDDTGLTYDVILLDGQTIPVYVRSNNAGSCPSGWEIVNAISTPSVAAPVFNVGLPVVHCQGAGTDTFTATSAETIVYSITINSGTGTNPTINSAIGEVTYPADFYGDITITATVTGCNVAAATHDVEVVKTLTPTITY